jgi:lipoprotein-anchoring transpeptidase ErfK/SrfK
MWRGVRLAAILGILTLCVAGLGAAAPARAEAGDGIGSRPLLRFAAASVRGAYARPAQIRSTYVRSTYVRNARVRRAHMRDAHVRAAHIRTAPIRAVSVFEAGYGIFAAPLRSLMPARLIERETAPSGPVHVQVSLGSQVMTVSVGGEALYRWPISSGRVGYNTPHGTYHPQRLATMWRSHKYHMSPMPHSIFFRGGFAIHGTYATAYLGARASHGCIRLSPGNAAALFSLVRGAGFGRTRITISG